MRLEWGRGSQSVHNDEARSQILKKVLTVLFLDLVSAVGCSGVETQPRAEACWGTLQQSRWNPLALNLMSYDQTFMLLCISLHLDFACQTSDTLTDSLSVVVL